MDRAPAFIIEQILAVMQRVSAGAFEQKYAIKLNKTDDYKEKNLWWSKIYLKNLS